jgi:glyoxylase-like metal-dependent hydrolase (beta-lactamase superfamily II)
VLALVDSIASDVVVITHAGLDQYGSFAELAKAVPLRETINVRAWRIPADEIPTGEGERIAWLDEQWVLVNEQVAQAARNPDANQQASATRGTFEPGHGAVEPA